MTDREKAIVMAYTGACMLTGEKFQIFHKYAEELMGGPVYTHQLGFGKFSEELKRRATPDFIKLCEDDDNSETKWIPVTEKLPEEACDCLVTARYGRTDYTEVLSCSYYPDTRSKWFLDNGIHTQNVTAWMPLPEPYKPESEE